MKTYVLAIIFSLVCFSVFAQSSIWTIGNARVIPARHVELSLFAPSRMGLKNKMVVSSRIVPLVFAPNVSLKKQWYYQKDNYYLTSRHSLHSPTTGFNLLKITGYKNYIPDTSSIPLTFVLINEIIASKWLVKRTSCNPPNYLLTIKAGLKYPFHSGGNTLPYFYDEPKYHHTIFYSETTPVWYAGLGMDGTIGYSFNFDFDIDFISVDWNIRDFAIQNVGVLILPIADRLSIAGGYFLLWGTNPNGSGLSLLPLIDIVWTLKRKNKREDGLFEKKMNLNFF